MALQIFDLIVTKTSIFREKKTHQVRHYVGKYFDMSDEGHD